MKRFRIMQVMPEFGLAGAETMCESLTYELLKQNDTEVYVVSLYDYQSAITERFRKYGVKFYSLSKKKGLDLGIIFRLAKLMKDLQINVVHTHRYVMQYAIPAADIANVKIRIHTVHNIATKEVTKYQRILAKYFYKFRNVTPVAISPIVKETILEEYDLNKEKVPMIYNGSNLTKFLAKDNYSTKNKSSFTFLNIGRLTPVKNQELIIKAVDQLKHEGIECNVNFLGEGHKLNDYKNLVSELNLTTNIKFLGVLPNVSSYLNQADAFLLPSLYEGMPISLIEAMASGLPIIASAVGGVPDMIQHNHNGLLINPTLEELTEAMRNIINNQNLREELGKNALKQANNFSSYNMMALYYKLYTKKL